MLTVFDSEAMVLVEAFSSEDEFSRALDHARKRPNMTVANKYV